MSRTKVPDQITVRRAAALSGLTPYTVDYLCRSRTLVPSGSAIKPGRGKRRNYTFGDVVILRALAVLLKQGLSVYRLREALQHLRSRHPEITPKSLPGKFLVTDGIEVFFRRNGSIENLNRRGQLAFGFVLELNRLRRDVMKKAKELGIKVG